MNSWERVSNACGLTITCMLFYLAYHVLKAWILS